MSANDLCLRCNKTMSFSPRTTGRFHARCFFTAEAQDDIYELKIKFRVSNERLAQDFGVSVNVIRATVACAMVRTGLRPCQPFVGKLP